METTGFDEAPARYRTGGGEAIDIIRATLGDDGFVAYCRGAALKYRLRAGKKGPAETDHAKAKWYTMMVDHVTKGHPDPRSYRE